MGHGMMRHVGMSRTAPLAVAVSIAALLVAGCILGTDTVRPAAAPPAVDSGGAFSADGKRVRIATGPNTGEFAWFQEATVDEVKAQKDGPFMIYDQESGGKVVHWYYTSVGIVPVGTTPEQARTMPQNPPATTKVGGP
jgi:hypothetical protein